MITDVIKCYFFNISSHVRWLRLLTRHNVSAIETIVWICDSNWPFSQESGIKKEHFSAYMTLSLLFQASEKEALADNQRKQVTSEKKAGKKLQKNQYPKGSPQKEHAQNLNVSKQKVNIHKRKVGYVTLWAQLNCIPRYLSGILLFNVHR